MTLSAAAPSPSIPASPLAAAQAELAARILCKRRLLPFVQRLNPRYDAGWVHRDICRRLEKFSDDVAKGLSPRLMILMPPRHGKSELASRMFPAWHLGRHMDHEVIACAYNVSLAMSFSRKVKEAMDDPAYQSVFDARLNPDFRSNEEWGLANGRGGYVAAGVGGGITGKGAHVLVIDDPIKNAEEADSADVREKLWDWYGSTAYTRLAPGGGVLVIQTWWHDDDLAGRLQTAMATDDEADQFELVKYPAVAESDEYLDYDTDLIVYDTPPPNGRPLRKKGEPLHPERYDLVKLNRIRKTIPNRFWAALYQQNPVPDDGAYFTKENFRRGKPPLLRESNIFVAFDFAISEKKQNDYTVGVVGLQDCDDVLHVVDMVRFKSGDGMFIVESILNLCQKWYSPHLQLGFEDGQIFRAIETLLKKRMRERRFYPSTVLLKPITDKMARARPLQGRMQQGMVCFSDTAEWYETARTEMLRFPAGVHDDQVDALAWMATMAVGKEPPRKPKTKEPESWRKKLSMLGGTVSHMAA
ncbi:phage terminase large subunit [Acidovorax sp. HMWF018]|uniref:phage terminase large subunit n=1 Tax=Acidovorax sp. HMWF018 TaxID=2056855 RepID=UPI001304EE4D|nr:phage terminase large subunit [Acidovorax sp. HMWF018]